MTHIGPAQPPFAPAAPAAAPPAPAAPQAAEPAPPADAWAKAGPAGLARPELAFAAEPLLSLAPPGLSKGDKLAFDSAAVDGSARVVAVAPDNLEIRAQLDTSGFGKEMLLNGAFMALGISPCKYQDDKADLSFRLEHKDGGYHYRLSDFVGGQLMTEGAATVSHQSGPAGEQVYHIRTESARIRIEISQDPKTGQASGRISIPDLPAALSSVKFKEE